MKKLKLAIIGYGRSGRNIHTKILKHLPDLYEIAYYVDEDPQRREMIKQEMNVPALADYTELSGIKDIDIVINASYSQDHVRISKDLMKRGFNVVSEKPVAKDRQEFQTVLDTAKETGMKYFAFQQARFAAFFTKLQEIIASGVLGKIVEITMRYEKLARRWDWQTIHENTAGVLLNNGSHNIDMALILMGFPKEIEVFAFMDRANFAGNAEDYARVIMRAPGVPLVNIENSHCNAYTTDILHVQGSNGTLKGDTHNLVWKFFKTEESPPLKLETKTLHNEKGEPIYCTETLKFYEESWKADTGEGNTNEVNEGLTYYRALYDSLVKMAEFPVKPEHLMLQMQVIEKAFAQNKDLFKS
jgi:predicted dehydrogenase